LPEQPVAWGLPSKVEYQKKPVIICCFEGEKFRCHGTVPFLFLWIRNAAPHTRDQQLRLGTSSEAKLTLKTYPVQRNLKVRLTKRMKSALAAKPADEAPLPLAEAVETLKNFPPTKFDQTVEIHIRLGIDPKQADQIVRGSIVLPHGIGKSKRVVVFAKGNLADDATAAGAEEVGGDDLAKKIKGGWTDFDVCIAAPDMMGLVGPLGKVLGPRGLMPSPRAGTVTADISKTVKEYKAGKVEFRNDPTGIIHAAVGKASFENDKLIDNIHAFLEQIRSMQPSAIRGQYIKTVAISATMSPGVMVAA
jgi:large subunit ribosomal protein L1